MSKQQKTGTLYYVQQTRAGWGVASVEATEKPSTYALPQRILEFNYRASVPKADACRSPIEAIERTQIAARVKASALKARLEYLESVIVALEALR